MNLPNGLTSLADVAQTLANVRSKGVELWSADNEVHYRGPKGALSREEIECLRTHRHQVIALLEQADLVSDLRRRLPRRSETARAPLAFAQRAHWNTYRLAERRAIRQIASATRIHGPLDLDRLTAALAQTVARHEALQTRVVVQDGVPLQEILPLEPRFAVTDLRSVPAAARDAAVARVIDEMILEPIDVACDPLFEARLLKLREAEHILVLVMEHMITDASSMDIVVRDLLQAYMYDPGSSECEARPAPCMQLADYALWQNEALPSWLTRHGEYCDRLLADVTRLRFPEDMHMPSATRAGWATAAINIDEHLKLRLQGWCRARQTTLVMSVFTAYVAAVLRWCHAREAVLQYESDGRFRPEFADTVGYFASPLHVHVDLQEHDTFVSLLDRVTQAYCTAFEHADAAYFAAQMPRPEFTRGPAFNWVPQGSQADFAASGRADIAIACSPLDFVHPMLRNLQKDGEPMMLLYDKRADIVGGVNFPLQRFAARTMEAFAQSFTRLLEVMVSAPNARIPQIASKGWCRRP